MKHSQRKGNKLPKNSSDDDAFDESDPDEIDETDEIDEIENPWTVEKVIDQAVVYLARRDHAEGELREKLRKKGIDDHLIDESYVDMRERGYLDDLRFAEIQGAILARRGWGPLQISQRLSTRGVSKHLITQALNLLETENETDWYKLCYERLVAKFGVENASELTQKQREKAYRHLMHRGFPGHVVRSILFD